MVNPCQFAKLLHSRRGRLVALGGCVRAAISPFYRQSCDIPGHGELDLEHSSGKQFRRGDVRLRLSGCLVEGESVHTVAASGSNSRLKM